MLDRARGRVVVDRGRRGVSADGPERAFDHYNGWALHVYPLLWASMDGSLCEPRLEAAWRDRLSAYPDTAVHLIGDHGVPDERGLLNLGWYGEWPAIAQSYSGPGSPYWAVKGMLGLMLPPDHPVWVEPEQPLPVESGDFTLELPESGWLISGTQSDGIVRIANHGTDHSNPGDRRADSPLYARLGYSTHTMPPLGKRAWSEAVESSISLVHPDLGASHRNGFTTVGRGGSVVDGPRVVMGSVVRGSQVIRAVLIPLDASLDPSWSLEISGWPLTANEPPTEVFDGPGTSRPQLIGSVELGGSGWRCAGRVGAGVVDPEGESVWAGPFQCTVVESADLPAPVRFQPVGEPA